MIAASGSSTTVQLEEAARETQVGTNTKCTMYYLKSKGLKTFQEREKTLRVKRSSRRDRSGQMKIVMILVHMHTCYYMPVCSKKTTGNGLTDP
jgi:hypothetical protein